MFVFVMRQVKVCVCDVLKTCTVFVFVMYCKVYVFVMS